MTTMRQRRHFAAYAVKPGKRELAHGDDWSHPTDWQSAVMQIALMRGPVRIAKLQAVMHMGYTKALLLFQTLQANGIVSAEEPARGMVKRIVTDKYIEYWVCQMQDRARFVEAIDDGDYDLARSVAKRLGTMPRRSVCIVSRYG